MATRFMSDALDLDKVAPELAERNAQLKAITARRAEEEARIVGAFPGSLGPWEPGRPPSGDRADRPARQFRRSG
jgi:hypothetical protein